MTCPIESREKPELLLDYCSHSVDPVVAAALEDHIEICPGCRKYVDNQRAIWRALDGWDAAPVSANFDQRLYQRIEREVSWWEMFIRPFRPMLFRQGLPITAAAAVVLVAGVLLDRPATVEPMPTNPEVVQVEAVAPEQAESALQEMELMRELNSLVQADPENFEALRLMTRVYQTVGLLLLAVSLGLCDQTAQKAARAGWLAPAAKGAVPKPGTKGVPKAPPVRISNPTSQAAHLYKLGPDQRDRALEKLPIAMQQRLRKELDQFDALPKEQQETTLRQAERYDALPPERQLAFRQQLRALSQLEKERRQQVTAALRRLYNLAPGERAKLLARPAFRERFSIEEFEIITTLGDVMLPPN